MGEVGRGPVVDVHLGAESRERGVGEQSWGGAAGVGPDYIWWTAVVPDCRFFEDALVFFWDGHVGAYAVESLLVWIFCCGLDFVKSCDEVS